MCSCCYPRFHACYLAKNLGHIEWWSSGRITNKSTLYMGPAYKKYVIILALYMHINQNGDRENADNHTNVRTHTRVRTQSHYLPETEQGLPLCWCTCRGFHLWTKGEVGLAGNVVLYYTEPVTSSYARAWTDQKYTDSAKALHAAC